MSEVTFLVPGTNRRALYLIKTLEHDLTTFSMVLGCTERQLSDYLYTATAPNLDFLALLLAHVDGLNADWLLTGRGRMLNEQKILTVKASTTTLTGNTGNTVALNHGIIINVTNAEYQVQLSMAMLLIEQQQRQLDDKDRIIKLLESLLSKD